MKKVTLFLMTNKGFQVLKQLIAEGRGGQVDCVVGARDANVVNDYFESIKSCCLENGITFYERTDSFKIKSEYSIAISWRWLITSDTTKLIVLHDSILPRYRGFAPLVNMLVNGEKYIGVSALEASGEYDKGGIYIQKRIAINYPKKIKDAIEELSVLYSEIVLECMNKINDSALIPTPQNEQEASYSLWLDEKNYHINWNEPAERIKRFIDAVGYPYLGAHTFIEGGKYTVEEAELVPDVKIENREPGKVIFVENKFPVIVCGSGILKITKLLKEDGTDALPLKKFRSRLD